MVGKGQVTDAAYATKGHVAPCLKQHFLFTERLQKTDLCILEDNVRIKLTDLHVRFPFIFNAREPDFKGEGFSPLNVLSLSPHSTNAAVDSAESILICSEDAAHTVSAKHSF